MEECKKKWKKRDFGWFKFVIPRDFGSIKFNL